MDSVSVCSRGCLCGIARYARSRPHWSLHHQPPPDDPAQIAAAIQAAQPDGIVARLHSPAALAALAGFPKPLIFAAMPAADTVQAISVATDQSKIVAVAVDHLLSCGFEHLAFFGNPADSDSILRQTALTQMPLPAHITRHCFDASTRDPAAAQQWLAALPKPVGILAFDDALGSELLNLCSAIGLRIPEQVAVVGASNDEVICELSRPPLSSVIPNFNAIGYRAARALDDLLEGRDSERAILIAPTGLEIRASSDIESLCDQVLAQAVRYIRNSVTQGVSVKDVLAHVGVSRSTLERRFLDQLGCTPHDYIVARQMELVRRLLLETTYSIRQISGMTGFRSPAHMIAAFKIQTSMTPGQFRENAG